MATKAELEKKIMELEAQVKATAEAKTKEEFIEYGAIFSIRNPDGTSRLAFRKDGIYYAVYPNKYYTPGSNQPKYRVGTYADNLAKQQAQLAAKEKDTK